MFDQLDFNDLVKFLPRWDSAAEEALQWIVRNTPEGWDPTTCVTLRGALRIASRPMALDGTDPHMKVFLYLGERGWLVTGYEEGSFPFAHDSSLVWADSPQEAYAIWFLNKCSGEKAG